ncbi:MAG TPA: flippase [Nitrospirae bacterium]|nr:teichuronic acid biosynthesis protein TuaB [bacterium BMS3Abin06]HDH13553.1 flippase [Nitrospirota bacterium]HDZ01007.1 flippase [Nitrospirota bacterium]
METVRRIARNTGVIIAGRIVSRLIGLVMLIFLTRYLGTSNFGIYSFVFAYLEFFGILMDLGIRAILVRDLSRDRSKADKLLGNAIIMKVVLSVFALLLACLIITFLKYPFDTKLLVYVASLSFLLSFGSLYGLMFQVDLEMKYPTLANIFSSVLKLTIFLYLIFMKAPLLWFIIAGIIAAFSEFLIILRLSRRYVRPKFEIDFKIWKNLFKESWPIALTATFIMIYNRIDQIMLFQMKGAQAVGNYAVAVRLTEAFNIIPAAFMTSVFPLFSEYFLASGEKLEKAYALSFKYMSILIMPIAVGISILSEPAIRILFGEQFIWSVQALRILIWSEVFVFLGAVHINILISTGLQKLDFIFTSSGAVVNIILNLLLIPPYGIVGAAIATFVSYGLGVPMSCILKKTRSYGKALAYSTLKPLIAAGIMGCFTYFAFFLHLPLAAIIFFSAIGYFAVIVLIGGVDRQDQEYFRKIVFRT